MASGTIMRTNQSVITDLDLTFVNGTADLDITTNLASWGLPNTSKVIAQIESGSYAAYGVHSSRISNGVLRVVLTDSNINTTIGCTLIIG